MVLYRANSRPCGTIETCQLCDQEEAAIKILSVGSQCILKFGLSVLESGQRLSPAGDKKKFDRLMKKMRLDSCIRALEGFAAADSSEILRNALTFYRKNKYLTPKFAVVVFVAAAEECDRSQQAISAKLMPAERRRTISSARSIWERECLDSQSCRTVTSTE